MSSVLRLQLGQLLRRCKNRGQQPTAHLSWKPTKYQYNSIKFNGLLTVVVTGVTCGILLWVEVYFIDRNISTITNVSDVNKSAEYISLFDTDVNKEVLTENWKKYINPGKSSKEWWFARILSRSSDPWCLLNLTRSKDQSIRHLGVQALADIDGWEDFQYRNIAQAADGRTLVGLARSNDIDLRFFLKPPIRCPIQISVHDELTNLLTYLPHADVDKCTQYFTKVALKHGKPPDDKGGFWSFGGKTLASPEKDDSLSEKTVELCSLQALLHHSMLTSHCVEIVQNGGLALLQRILDDKPNCLKTHVLVARILANLATVEDLHKQILASGWVTILAKWMKSTSLVLSTLAAKTLLNLDRDFTSDVLDDGVYVFHPVHRTRSVIDADIVFVHGVLGGCFRSWRYEHTPDEINGDTYSSCWPKEWLAEDIKGVRIICVDYNTHLSEWYASCPYDTQNRSLVKRGEAMIEKLRKAGVGDRPIIWAGHSLGGLLVKEILSLAADDRKYNCIKDQTKGIIFYSVPHHGSPFANMSNQVRYIIYPSIEVQDLQHNSPNLEMLHKKFMDIVEEKSIECLSFGETKKTYIKKAFSNLLVVPLESSDPGYGEFCPVEEDHINICKPQNKDSKIYTLTLEFVENCLRTQA